MKTITEKQEPVSIGSYNLHSKAAKNVDKLWQARQPDFFTNIN